MSTLKRLWTNITQFAEALDGMDDDPADDYMISLGNRLAKLEREMETRERQLRSNSVGGIHSR